MKPLTWRSISSKALQSLLSLPMCQASTCGQVLAVARVHVLQNRGSRMVSFKLRFTTRPARDRHWRNPRRAQQYKKRSCQCNDGFPAYRIVVLGLFKLNIKARHEIPEFMNANLWSIHLFFLHTVFAQCSSSTLLTSKKWGENRTDLRDRGMDGWSVTQ